MIPMSTYAKLWVDPDGKVVNPSHFSGMISALLYVTASKPAIMFPTHLCVGNQASPKESLITVVKTIFLYLIKTPNLCPQYPKDSCFDLIGYTDSNYVGCTLDRKITLGCYQMLGGRLISCLCKKQTLMDRQTTEAKYVADGRCYAQVLWIQNQL